MNLKSLYPIGLSLFLLCLSGQAAEPPAAAVSDSQQLAGTWQAVRLEINGDVTIGDETRQLTVVNKADGTWKLFSDGKQIAHGTSRLNPGADPPEIDFSATNEEGTVSEHRGIYQLNANSRKLCFAPAGQPRPTTFSSPPGSQNVYVEFDRIMRK